MAPREPSAWSGFNRTGSSSSYFGDNQSKLPDLSSFGSYKSSTQGFGANDSTNWKSGFGVDKTGLWERSFGQYKDPEESYLNKVKKNLFDKTKERQQYGFTGGQGTGVAVGEGSSASGGQVLENFGYIQPAQHAITVAQGTPGRRGFLSQIAGIAAPVVGMMGGPIAPFISAGLGGIGQTDW